MSDHSNSLVDLRIKKVNCWYGDKKVLHDVSLNVDQRAVFALIGPSGCGKSTLLRSINRMNDFVSSFKLKGQIHYGGQEIYAPDCDPVELRSKIGMVFQRPNPFPSSIFQNVIWGAKINGLVQGKGAGEDLVEDCLRKAALWDEVKDQLHKSGLSLSGGQQQRLCIARALALKPKVILMDEPCSALDPIATKKIESLIKELKKEYCILVVTHNMQQAQRISDYTAFLYEGEMVEFSETQKLFNSPSQKLTKDYIAGDFG